MVDNIAPVNTGDVDTSVRIPPSVRREAEAAEAAHKAIYGAHDPAQAPAPAAAGTEAPDPAVVAAPEVPVAPVEPPSRPEDRSGVDPQSFEGRYYAMEGRYRQSQTTIGSMQQTMADLGDELTRMQQVVADMRANGTQPQAPQEPQQPQRLLTDKDLEVYGPEFFDVVKRAAMEAVAPEIQTVRQQTRQVSQRVAQQSNQTVQQQLATEVPNWGEINRSPRFKAWCRSPDVYSGQLRGRLLNEAFRAANAPRVIAFFKGFLQEEVATGNAPDPASQPPVPPAPRQAAVPLETLTAPGRAKPATGATPGTAEKPVFTRAQIQEFYTNVRRGAYAGREADKVRDEQAIFAAQREGRVR